MLAILEKTREEQLEQHGFTIVEDVLSQLALRATIAALESIETHGPGTRNLLESNWCRALGAGLKDNPEIARVLLPIAVAIQCTFFDKTPEANWLVAFHHDVFSSAHPAT